MDFKKLLTAPVHAGQAVIRDLAGNDEDNAARDQVLKMLGAEGASDMQKYTPAAPTTEFNLPGLDESLSEAGQKRKAEAEAKGEPFTAGENDYTDSGPYGYLHKKAIHDSLMELEKEMQANRPHIDYEGIMKQRMAELANAPEEHRTNPLYLFAMGMGNPEHAAELVATHNKAEAAANEKQAGRWNELLDMKKQALEGSIKQAMAEGDARKVISGKWLETLAQIEQDKAKLAGQMQVQGEKNAGAERRVALRGQWALDAVKARAGAMLQAVGIKQNSAEWRSMQDNARVLLNGLIKKGTDPEDAYDQVTDWMHEQLDSRPSSAAGAAPAPGAVAPPPASTNPMEDEIRRARTGGKP